MFLTMLETFTPYVSNIPGTPREALLASFMEIKLERVINGDIEDVFWHW